MRFIEKFLWMIGIELEEQNKLQLIDLAPNEKDIPERRIEVPFGKESSNGSN